MLDLEIDVLFSEFDDSISPVKHNFDLCCGNATVVIESNKTCLTCGNFLPSLLLSPPERYGKTTSNYRKRSIYKRCDYFRHILRLLTCRAQLLPAGYDEVVLSLKDKAIKNIFELKKAMKEMRLNKYYPFIYIIYQNLTGIILFNLTNKQFYSFCDLFKQIEWTFKKKSIHRHNFYSYNTFIYCLLVNHNIGDVGNIILPESNKELIEKIQSLILYFKENE